jgi:hypothetical protein
MNWIIKSELSPDNLQAGLLEMAGRVAQEHLREQARQAAAMRMNMLGLKALVPRQGGGITPKPASPSRTKTLTMSDILNLAALQQSPSVVLLEHSNRPLSAAERINCIRTGLFPKW